MKPNVIKCCRSNVTGTFHWPVYDWDAHGIPRKCTWNDDRFICGSMCSWCWTLTYIAGSLMSRKTNYYVFEVNDKRGNRDQPPSIFKTNTKKLRIAVALDNYCWNHKHVRKFLELNQVVQVSFQKSKEHKVKATLRRECRGIQKLLRHVAEIDDRIQIWLSK